MARDLGVLHAVNFPLILTVLVGSQQQIFAEEHLRPNHTHGSSPDILRIVTDFIHQLHPEMS